MENTQLFEINIEKKNDESIKLAILKKEDKINIVKQTSEGNEKENTELNSEIKLHKTNEDEIQKKKDKEDLEIQDRKKRYIESNNDLMDDKNTLIDNENDQKDQLLHKLLYENFRKESPTEINNQLNVELNRNIKRVSKFQPTSTIIKNDYIKQTQKHNNNRPTEDIIAHLHEGILILSF
jgi:hypothetical protein